MDTHSLNVISLCTGGSGLDLGLHLACGHARPVCYVEREAFACAHLVAAIEAGLLADAPLWSDVASFRGRAWRGAVDFVIGGIPCQPHSAAGKKRGSNDERDLWSAARRIVVQSGAWGVLIENVEGMLSAGEDEIAGAERVWRDLQRLGFVVEGGLFSASETGASHRRARVFILAVHERRLADAHGGGFGRESYAAFEPSWIDRRDSVLGDPDFQRRGKGRAKPAVRGGKPAADGAGEPVGDAERPRRTTPGGRRQVEPAQQSEPGGVPVADRDDRFGDRSHGYLRAGWNPSDGGGGVMADADEPFVCGQSPAGQLGVDEPDTRAGRDAMADADAGGRRRRTDVAQRRPVDGAAPEWTGVGVQPPGPSDHERWRTVIGAAPMLEPAFRRMADGVAAEMDADRVDRLRMLGNGVHPLAAAYAIRTLSARLAARGAGDAAEFLVNSFSAGDGNGGP